jgi:protein involved in ribonucleotide reduction
MNAKDPLIVYFSNVSENTLRFVAKLPYEALRIPVHFDKNPLTVDRDYILVLPTYGSGADTKAIPRQVIKFLNIEENRNHCKAVIGGGNTSFGEGFVKASRQISSKLQIPIISIFEVFGTTKEVDETIKRIESFWRSQ